MSIKITIMQNVGKKPNNSNMVCKNAGIDTMELPTFPSFVDICDFRVNPGVLGDEDFAPYSDFIFSNVWSWNLDKSFKVSELNGNVILFLRDHRTKEFFLSIKGKNKLNETFAFVLSQAKFLDLPQKLNLVPEETAINLDKTRFKVVEDRDSFDYIYNAEKLFTLPGKSLKTKRRLCNQFEKDNPKHNFVQATLSPEIKMEILKFMSAESARRSKLGHTPFAEYEMAALECFLLLPQNQNIIAFLLYVDEEIVACSIDELLPRNFALSHFFKSSIICKGSYDFLNRAIANYLKQKDVQYWNWVEDSGLMGLRQAKLAYKPEYLLKKYTVTSID